MSPVIRTIAATVGTAGLAALLIGLAFPPVAALSWLGAILLAGAFGFAVTPSRGAAAGASTALRIQTIPGRGSADTVGGSPQPVGPAGGSAGRSAPGVGRTDGAPHDADSGDAIPSPSEVSDLRDAETTVPVGVEPSDALESFARTAAGCGEPVSAALWLLDPATRTMRLVVAFGKMRPDAEPLPVEGSVQGRVAESGRASLEAVRRLLTHDTWGAGLQMAPQPKESTLWRYAVPLKAGDALGAAVLEFRCDEPDRAALNRAAGMERGPLSAALALHVSRTETESATALLAAAREILRLVDEEAILETAVRHAQTLSAADTASVMLLDSGSRTLAIRAALGLPERVVRETCVSEGEGIAGWVLATNSPLVVEDLEDKGPRSRRHGIRSAMAVPIGDEDGVLGVLNVGSKVFHARFSASHLASLESLGRALALALRNAAALESSRDLYLETIRALALAIETKDPYSRGAADRVYDLASRLGATMGLSATEQQALSVASLLHDVGMAAAGDLSAVGHRPLSTEEWAMLKMHPVIASDVLEQARALKAAVPIVYHHHEHYDGQGYVLGIAGEQIPLGARVLSVADAYVAMTSPRPYRPARSHEEALVELSEKSGSQFDPAVVRALMDMLGRGERVRRDA